MEDEYRIVKVSYAVGDLIPGVPAELRDLFPEARQIITRYEVQVKGTFLWHTIKQFRKIRPAFRLLTLLKDKEDETKEI